jgi:hypothetical protein
MCAGSFHSSMECGLAHSSRRRTRDSLAKVRVRFSVLRKTQLSARSASVVILRSARSRAQ